MLGWIVIGLPAMLAIVVFALSNREPVSLAIWPWTTQWQVPLYLVVLGVAAVAFLLGASLGWISAFRARLQASGDRRRLSGLTKEQTAWHDQGKRDAEGAYRVREEDRYAKAIQGRQPNGEAPANDPTDQRPAALPAVT